MANGAAPRDYSIAVLERALDVLEMIDGASSPLGATEIARRIGSTKSAAYRILVNLEHRGYVTKDDQTTHYSLGPRLSHFGLGSDTRVRLIQFAHPHLESLSKTFGETANLGVLDGNQMLYLDIVESRHDLRMAARVGARDAVYSTALGKAMLAFLPDQEIDRILSGTLPRRTDRTVTDVSRIWNTLEDIRKSGISAEFGENEPSACCFGVPVFGPDRQPVAAISLSGPEGRMMGTGIERIRNALAATGRSITQRIGG